MKENQNQTQNTEIDIVGILRALWTKAWLVAIAIIVGGAIGFIYSKGFIAPTYDSTVSIYVINNANDQAITYTDTQLSLQVVRDYKELITCREVLQRTIDKGSLTCTPAQLKKMISMSNKESTRIIDITIRNTDPDEAFHIAMTLCDVSSDYIQGIIGLEAVKQLGDASRPKTQSGPSVSRYTIVGALIAALIVIIILVIIFLLDNTIKSSEDVERYLGWPTLASIPMRKEKTKSSKKTKK